ncbi:hypothetical protein pb186bvf_017407 [Paramecium bursaria]
MRKKPQFQFTNDYFMFIKQSKQLKITLGIVLRFAQLCFSLNLQYLIHQQIVQLFQDTYKDSLSYQRILFSMPEDFSSDQIKFMLCILSLCLKFKIYFMKCQKKQL